MLWHVNYSSIKLLKKKDSLDSGKGTLGNSIVDVCVWGLGTFGVMVAAGSVYSGCGLEHTGCRAWIFFEVCSKPEKNMNRRVASRRQVILE